MRNLKTTFYDVTKKNIYLEVPFDSESSNTNMRLEIIKNLGGFHSRINFKLIFIIQLSIENVFNFKYRISINLHSASLYRLKKQLKKLHVHVQWQDLLPSVDMQFITYQIHHIAVYVTMFFTKVTILFQVVSLLSISQNLTFFLFLKVN